MPTKEEPPAAMLHLQIDAMYFHAARESYERALACTKRIERAEGKLLRLQRAWNDAARRHADDASARVGKQEPLAIQMESAEHDVGATYAPRLEALATTHILCAAALESHVNLRAQELLAGKKLDHFERVSLEGKWLFLPCIGGSQGFDAGAQPFQGLSRLVSIRNELIHYKGRQEPWDSAGTGVPEFLAKLGLVPEAAAESLTTVRAMILELARLTGGNAPPWLRNTVSSYFQIRFEHARR